MHATRSALALRSARAAVICLAIPALGALPGCARIERFKQKFAPETGFVEPARPNDSCNSLPYREYVGAAPDALSDLVFGGPVRWVHAGDTVGEDYDPTRLNFDLDSSGTITRVWCG